MLMTLFEQYLLLYLMASGSTNAGGSVVVVRDTDELWGLARRIGDDDGGRGTG
jgi:hypothetical protein